MSHLEKININYEVYKKILKDIVYFTPFQNSDFNQTFLLKEESKNIMIYNFIQITPIIDKMTISIFTKDCKKFIDEVISERFENNPNLFKISIDILSENDAEIFLGKKFSKKIEAKLREHIMIDNEIRDLYILSVFREEAK